MLSMATRLSGKARAIALINAWEAADRDADIEFRVGRRSDGEPAVMVTVAGDPHILTAHEASHVCAAIESGMDPSGAQAGGYDTLLSGLRQAIAEPNLPTIGHET